MKLIETEQGGQEKRTVIKFQVNKIILLIAIIAIVVAIGAIAMNIRGKKADAPAEAERPTVITTSTLKDIVDIDDLSTYKVEYGGVATVYDEKKTDKVDYYVSYKANVKAGISFSEIEIMVDTENKRAVAILPPIKIEKTIVADSLDYLFYDKKLNKAGVSKGALDACKADLEQELQNNTSIKRLAAENAQRAVDALLRPFIEDIDPEYELEIRVNEG